MRRRGRRDRLRPAADVERLLEGPDARELALGAGEQLDVVDDVRERLRVLHALDRAQAGAEEVARGRQGRLDRPPAQGELGGAPQRLRAGGEQRAAVAHEAAQRAGDAGIQKSRVTNYDI